MAEYFLVFRHFFFKMVISVANYKNNMTQDYLKVTRQNGESAGNVKPEPFLINERDDVKDAWDEIQRIRTVIAEKQVEAAKAVAQEYDEELREALAQYALLISLAR